VSPILSPLNDPSSRMTLRDNLFALFPFSGSFSGLLLSVLALHGIPNKDLANFSQHLSWLLDRHMPLGIYSSRIRPFLTAISITKLT